MVILALKLLRIEQFSIIEGVLLVDVSFGVVEVIRVYLMFFDEVFTKHFDSRGCLAH